MASRIQTTPARSESRRVNLLGLTRAGLERCEQMRCAAVVVLGHPQYYPRFEFVPASSYDISSVYDVPDEVFMALELIPGALSGKAGKMYYHKAFDGL